MHIFVVIFIIIVKMVQLYLLFLLIFIKKLLNISMNKFLYYLILNFLLTLYIFDITNIFIKPFISVFKVLNKDKIPII